MKAHVVIHTNPFDPRAIGTAEVRRPVRVRRLAPQGRPVVARLNGRWILRAEWRRKLRDGDHLSFHVLPEGGGNGGSNPLQLVLSIALMSFAPWAAASLLGTTTALVGTTFIGQLTTTAIMLAGSAAISALIPYKQQDVLSLPAASPTYSLQAQGNAARLEQPIPVQYGRMRFTPDFAAQPYTEFAGQDQYLYQLLCLGQGEFDVERIQFDDTDVAAFSEITTEIVPPGGTVTLFPTAVVTSAEVGGQELVGMVTGTYAQSGTTLTVTETAHGRAIGQIVALQPTSGAFTAQVVTIASVPSANTWTATLGASATTSGSVNVETIVGGSTGMVASGPGKVANRLAVDVVLPRGLFDGTGSSLAAKSVNINVQAIRLDDSGTPISGWFLIGNHLITDTTTTPIRKSFSYDLATPGRYAVRASRLDAKDTRSAVGHEILWGGLRAYLQEPKSYGQVTLLAMRMRATNNLTAQASRLVRVTATRKLPIWDGSTWSAPTATRSIAWALADAARNSVYGAGRPDAQIDLAALLALDAIWTARGDQFDGRFDQSATFWDALTKIAVAGRARPFLQGGILRIVRDAPATIPVAMFSMRNMIAGSFSIDYLMPNEDTADTISVSYFDGTSWAPQRVSAGWIGSSGTKPVKVEMFGITTRAQALREGMYLAACNRYRRRIVSFSTEMDGFIPAIGDLIAVQHDMPGWGVQAEAVGYVAASRTLTLSEPVTFGTGSHYVAMRRKDGSVSGPWVVKAGKTPYQVVFTGTPDYTPYTGSEYDRTVCTFGAGRTWSALAKVREVKPKGLHRCDIEAVIEAPEVHTAEIGVLPPPLTISSLAKVVTRPVVKGFLARLHPSDSSRVLLAWEPVPGATEYHVEMAEGDNADTYTGSWTRVGDTTSSSYTVSLINVQRTLIRIRGVGLAPGDWTAAALGSLLARFWSNDPAAVVWTTGTDPFWRPL